MRRWFDHIRTTIPWLSHGNAASPADLPAADGQEGIRYVLVDGDKEARPRILISLLGDTPPNIAEILDAVAAACREAQEFPVIVMSELRPDLIAVTAAPIEFMPSRRHLRLLRDDEYQRYVRRRWALIMAKWNFASEIELSLTFDEFLATQMAAPAQDIAEPSASSKPVQERHEAAHRLEPKTQAAR